MEALRNDLMTLQSMQRDGMLSAEEAHTMKAERPLLGDWFTRAIVASNCPTDKCLYNILLLSLLTCLQWPGY